MTKYLNDGIRYAADLTAAAQAGDWELYKEIQREFSAEATLQVVADMTRAEYGRQQAITAVSEDIPEFKNVYGTSEWNEALSKRPRLAEAISQAETTLAVQNTLSDLYKMGYDVYQAAQPQKRHSAWLAPLRTETTPTAFTEQEIFRATEQAKTVDLSASNRKSLIAQLEDSGVLDQQF